MAPVEMAGMPKRWAKNVAWVPFPAPGGPIMISRTTSVQDIAVRRLAERGEPRVAQRFRGRLVGSGLVGEPPVVVRPPGPLLRLGRIQPGPRIRRVVLAVGGPLF